MHTPHTDDLDLTVTSFEVGARPGQAPYATSKAATDAETGHNEESTFFFSFPPCELECCHVVCMRALACRLSQRLVSWNHMSTSSASRVVAGAPLVKAVFRERRDHATATESTARHQDLDIVFGTLTLNANVQVWEGGARFFVPSIFEKTNAWLAAIVGDSFNEVT